MSMETVLAQLILEDNGDCKTLIFALAEKARTYIETGLMSSAGTASSIRAMINSRKNIKILFLGKLQYLFMYLTKFEFEDVGSSIYYTKMIIYGLDELLGCDERPLSAHQSRLANLIFNVAFKLKSKHQFKIQFVPSGSKEYHDLNRLEQYWSELTSH